jgi:hypothetical protein
MLRIPVEQQPFAPDREVPLERKVRRYPMLLPVPNAPI